MENVVNRGRIVCQNEPVRGTCASLFLYKKTYYNRIIAPFVQIGVILCHLVKNWFIFCGYNLKKSHNSGNDSIHALPVTHCNEKKYDQSADD